MALSASQISSSRTSANHGATLKYQFGIWISGIDIFFKINKLISCKLTKLTEELVFDFAYGACNTYLFGILLCWGTRIQGNSGNSRTALKECYSINDFDNKLRQRKHSWSRYSHHDGSLASYKGSPFITAGSDGLKTELYRVDWMEWIAKADFPTEYTDDVPRYVTDNN